MTNKNHAMMQKLKNEVDNSGN